MLDFPTRTIQTQSAPENAGTKHLVLQLERIEKSKSGDLRAELTMDTFLGNVSGGSEVKKIGTKRYSLPSSRRGLTQSALYSLDFSDQSIEVDLVKVDHINEHLGEVELMGRALLWAALVVSHPKAETHKASHRDFFLFPADSAR
jgi:hypothetical protein